MQEFCNTQMFTAIASAEDDPIEALVRRGAKVMLEAALEQEVAEYLERSRHQRSEAESEFRGYRNGHSPERRRERRQAGRSSSGRRGSRMCQRVKSNLNRK